MRTTRGDQYFTIFTVFEVSLPSDRRVSLARVAVPGIWKMRCWAVEALLKLVAAKAFIRLMACERLGF
jgi:hypothetical protein